MLLPWGGGGAIKADRVCRLVLAGVRTCSPFEEGLLHSWMGGLYIHPLGWKVKRSKKKKTARGGEPARLPLITGGIMFTRCEWDSCPATHKGCFRSLASLPCRCRRGRGVCAIILNQYGGGGVPERLSKCVTGTPACAQLSEFGDEVGKRTLVRGRGPPTLLLPPCVHSTASAGSLHLQSFPDREDVEGALHR